MSQLGPALRYIEPTFFAGLFDDPLLYLKVRPLGRGLLFDCGRLHHVAKRVFKSLDAIFVSHAHMDHFMGVDELIRTLHVAPRTTELYGPPGIIAKFEHKLQAYDWNLAEPWWGSWSVTEIGEDGLRRARFVGPGGFRRQDEETLPRTEVIYRNELLQVQAVLLDHKLPVLGYRIEERCGFRLDPERMAASGLRPGPWIAELNRRWRAGDLVGPLEVLQPSGIIEVADAAALFADLRAEQPATGIGYLTDIGWSTANRQRLVDRFRGLGLLVVDCAFLAAEKDQARRSWHLCSSDLNRLLDDLRPRAVLPMHLSKTYLEDSQRLYLELEPPSGTDVLRLPDYLSARPLRADEVAGVRG